MCAIFTLTSSPLMRTWTSFMMSVMASIASAMYPSPNSSFAEMRRTPFWSSSRLVMAASVKLRNTRDRM
ncbi:MAG: hypothetical protein ABS61_05505 [Microbacterium sp. SCN 70-18]|nr:MAG: hypothetical protein ABS61_05505 [Microbacterium sp. SCN 70-18]